MIMYTDAMVTGVARPLLIRKLPSKRPHYVVHGKEYI